MFCSRACLNWTSREDLLCSSEKPFTNSANVSKTTKLANSPKNGGDEGCLYNLGCLGMDTGCDIPTRKWLNGINSCTGSGAGCIGCTENVFPDFGERGIYKHLHASLDEVNKIENKDVREAVLKLKENGGVING